ncbi:MAG TPA: GIY-YIG nuclease family protein [Bacteroidales bacterium]|jgi:putative endonuclease|nr:GIY-YIG nuclease family protein [Bacteroidales bacterium]
MALVYILYSSSSDRYYIGSTTQPIEERLHRHLSDHNGFTAKAKDWIVVYSEEFADKSSALSREKQIKSWKSKSKIKDLIDNRSSQA